MGYKNRKDCRGGEDCHDDTHLCKIAGRRDLDTIRELVKEAQYICKKCGRAARNYTNLCKPEDI